MQTKKNRYSAYFDSGLNIICFSIKLPLGGYSSVGCSQFVWQMTHHWNPLISSLMWLPAVPSTWTLQGQDFCCFLLSPYLLPKAVNGSQNMCFKLMEVTQWGLDSECFWLYGDSCDLWLKNRVHGIQPSHYLAVAVSCHCTHTHTHTHTGHSQPEGDRTV